MNWIKNFWKWIKNFLHQDIVIIENCKNSKITINGKVVFDDITDRKIVVKDGKIVSNTKNNNFKGWFTTNNQVNNYNKYE